MHGPGGPSVAALHGPGGQVTTRTTYGVTDLLSIEDSDDLKDGGTILERLLNDLRVRIKRLVGSKEETPLPPTSS